MHHNKKLLAAAVAGAFAIAPAIVAAQTSTVQIGGSANFNYYITDPNNSTPNLTGVAGKKTDVAEGSEPELYVRGEENLGGGLSYWFQCASSMDFINGSGVGICTRNSAIGVKGNWGNVFAGNWDTPLKMAFNGVRGWFSGTNTLYGGSGNLLYGGTGGLTNPVQTITATLSTTGVTQLSTATSNAPGAFFRRQSNLISYHSPVWNGFNVKAAYSTGQENTGLGASPLKPRLYSLAGEYANGPWFAQMSFERHSDYNPANATVGGATGAYMGGDDDKWAIGGGYTFSNNFRLSGLYTETKYETTNITDLKISGWAFYADWKIQGPHSVRAQYATLDDTKGSASASVGSYKGPSATNCGITGTVSCASGTGADMYTLVYGYEFSKRTMFNLVYNRLSNDNNGTISQGKVASTVGGSQSSYGLAINHRF